MFNGIRIMFHRRLNKGFSSIFCEGSRVREDGCRQEIPKEGWRAHRLKGCQYSNKDEDNSPNTLIIKPYLKISDK